MVPFFSSSSVMFLVLDNFAKVEKEKIHKINNVLSFLLSITVTWLNLDLICFMNEAKYHLGNSDHFSRIYGFYVIGYKCMEKLSM